MRKRVIDSPEVTAPKAQGAFLMLKRLTCSISFSDGADRAGASATCLAHFVKNGATTSTTDTTLQWCQTWRPKHATSGFVINAPIVTITNATTLYRRNK
jgi:hypothetical protein